MIYNSDGNNVPYQTGGNAKVNKPFIYITYYM